MIASAQGLHVERLGRCENGWTRVHGSRRLDEKVEEDSRTEESQVPVILE